MFVDDSPVLFVPAAAALGTSGIVVLVPTAYAAAFVDVLPEPVVAVLAVAVLLRRTTLFSVVVVVAAAEAGRNAALPGFVVLGGYLLPEDQQVWMFLKSYSLLFPPILQPDGERSLSFDSILSHLPSPPGFCICCQDILYTPELPFLQRVFGALLVFVEMLVAPAISSIAAWHGFLQTFATMRLKSPRTPLLHRSLALPHLATVTLASAYYSMGLPAS